MKSYDGLMVTDCDTILFHGTYILLPANRSTKNVGLLIYFNRVLRFTSQHIDSGHQSVRKESIIKSDRVQKCAKYARA